MLSAYGELFINDSIEAAKHKIIRVDFSKVKKIKRSLKGKKTEKIISALEKNKYIYKNFFNADSLEIIMAAEAILNQRRKDCQEV